MGRMHATGMRPEGACFEWDPDINNISAPGESVYWRNKSLSFNILTLQIYETTHAWCHSIIQMCLVHRTSGFVFSVWYVSHPEHCEHVRQCVCIVVLCKSTPPSHSMSESAALETTMWCTLIHRFLQVDWQEQRGRLMFTAPRDGKSSDL